MDERVFRSTLHPGERSVVMVHATHVVRPLALLMLPVMVLTLIAILEGVYILLFAITGFAAALGTSTLWTHFQLRRHPAEIRLRGQSAAVRSLWDVASDRPPRWRPVFDIRDTRDVRTITVGYRSYDLDKREWPDMDVMTEALRETRQHPLAFHTQQQVPTQNSSDHR